MQLALYKHDAFVPFSKLLFVIATLIIAFTPKATAKVTGWPLKSDDKAAKTSLPRNTRAGFFDFVWGSLDQLPSDLEDGEKIKQQIILYAPSVTARSSDPQFREPGVLFKRREAQQVGDSSSKERKFTRLRRRRRLRPGVNPDVLREYDIQVDDDGYEYLDEHPQSASLKQFNEDRLYGAPTLENERAFVKGISQVMGGGSALSRTAKIMQHAFGDTEDEIQVFDDLDPVEEAKIGRWTYHALAAPVGGLATRYSLTGTWEHLLEDLDLIGDSVPEFMVSKKHPDIRTSVHLDSLSAPPPWLEWLKDIRLNLVRAPNVFAQAPPEAWLKPVAWTLEPQITVSMVGIHVEIEVTRVKNRSISPKLLKMVMQNACDVLDWMSPAVVDGNYTAGNNLQICCGCTMGGGRSVNSSMLDLQRLALVHRGTDADVYYGFVSTAQVPLDPSILSTYGLPIHPASKELNKYASVQSSTADLQQDTKRKMIDPELFLYDYEPDLTHQDLIKKLEQIRARAQADKPTKPGKRPGPMLNEPQVAVKGRLLTEAEDQEFWNIVAEIQRRSKLESEPTLKEPKEGLSAHHVSHPINLLSALLQSPLRDQCFDSASGIHSLYASVTLSASGLEFVEYIKTGNNSLAKWNSNHEVLKQWNDAHIQISNEDYISSGFDLLVGHVSAFAIRSACVADTGQVLNFYDIDELELERQAEEQAKEKARKLKEAQERLAKEAEEALDKLAKLQDARKPKKPVNIVKPRNVAAQKLGVQKRVQRSVSQEEDPEDEEEENHEEQVDAFDPTVAWKTHVDISMARILPPGQISDGQELQAPSPCTLPPPELNLTTRIEYSQHEPSIGLLSHWVSRIKALVWGTDGSGDGIGFHPTVIVEWDVPSKLPKFVPILYLVLQLEPGLFPDIYQLETYKSTGRYLGVWTWGSNDLEAPVDAGPFIGYGGVGMAVDLSRGAVQIPLHARYPEPGQDTRAVKLSAPMAFLRLHPKYRNLQSRVGCLAGPAVLPLIAPLARLIDQSKQTSESDPSRLMTDVPILSRFDLSKRQGLGLYPIPNFAVAQRPDFHSLSTKSVRRNSERKVDAPPFNLHLESWMDTFVIDLPTGNEAHAWMVTFLTLCAMLYGASWLISETVVFKASDK